MKLAKYFKHYDRRYFLSLARRFYLVTKNIFFKQKEHIHLFILCPPYCGSTLMNEILSQSSNVSSNNVFGTREGQKLPQVRKLLFDQGWKKGKHTDWPRIKRIWRQNWDLNKSLLLEKSPTNISRVPEILEHFRHAKFIIMVRDPIPFVDGLRRRNSSDIFSAIHFVKKAYDYQLKNMKSIPLED